MASTDSTSPTYAACIEQVLSNGRLSYKELKWAVARRRGLLDPMDAAFAEADSTMDFRLGGFVQSFSRSVRNLGDRLESEEGGWQPIMNTIIAEHAAAPGNYIVRRLRFELLPKVLDSGFICAMREKERTEFDRENQERKIKLPASSLADDLNSKLIFPENPFSAEEFEKYQTMEREWVERQQFEKWMIGQLTTQSPPAFRTGRSAEAFQSLLAEIRVLDRIFWSLDLSRLSTHLAGDTSLFNNRELEPPTRMGFLNAFHCIHLWALPRDKRRQYVLFTPPPDRALCPAIAMLRTLFGIVESKGDAALCLQKIDNCLQILRDDNQAILWVKGIIQWFDANPGNRKRSFEMSEQAVTRLREAFPEIYSRFESFSSATGSKHPFWYLIDQKIYDSVEWISLSETKTAGT